MGRKKRTSTQIAWHSMRQRCNNPRCHHWAGYGGRGIRICERWTDYENFLADMGEKPVGLSLDRVDVNGDYTPTNCRWATRKEQQRNQRVTRHVTIDGAVYVAADLAERSGLKTDTIIERASRGLSLDETLTPDRRVFKEGLALGGRANGARQQARTHCARGHKFTPENTRITKEGWRNCRACHNDKMRRRNAAKRDSAH
jgi:hypothetical protein